MYKMYAYSSEEAKAPFSLSMTLSSISSNLASSYKAKRQEQESLLSMFLTGTTVD